jgi:phasin
LSHGKTSAIDPKEYEIMMDPKLTMEVPPQVREFAEKSVDQTEKAISSFMDSASRSVAMVPGPMTDVAKHALAIAEANLKASFDHARKLLHAKDVNEVMQLQSEFLRAQVGAATEQFKQMSGATVTAARDAENKTLI